MLVVAGNVDHLEGDVAYVWVTQVGVFEKLRVQPLHPGYVWYALLGNGQLSNVHLCRELEDH